MSEIEYNNLLFEISRKLDELDARKQLLIMCRGKVATRSEDSIQDVFSLFEELEQKGFLGLDRLGILKDMLKGVKEWALFGKVKKFESKRKEYIGLLEQIICDLDELNDLERLTSICRGKITEASGASIHDARSLFQELENHNCLGIDCLDILKEILTQTEQNDLLKKLEELEERRNREDEFESRKAQATAFVSSVGNKLIGVLNIKTVFKVVSGGIITASTLEVLSRGSSFDQLVAAIDRCVLPAGASLLQITEGCVCLTVQADDLSALSNLWSLYQNGTLTTRLQTFFVTDELRELAGGEQVEAIVTIDEQEYEKARVELTNQAQDGDCQEEEMATKTHRRNSDSSLYCKTLRSEGPKVRTIQPEKRETKYLDQEKLAFVQEYLGKAEDARSMTTETSDSGMPGTHSAPSELGMDEKSDSYHNLCLKDLSKAVIDEVVRRLQHDFDAKKRFCQSFGLNTTKPFSNMVEDISELFPDTPVKLLKEVFEALQLYDLMELLEKAKPRTLRPALPLKEIAKLPSRADGPVMFYSKASVLIIDNTTTAENNTAERISSFFKDLNARTKVITITSRPLVEITNVLRGFEDTKHYFEFGGAEMKEKELKKSLEDHQREAKKLKKLLMQRDFFADPVWHDLWQLHTESEATEEESAKKELEEQIEVRKKWKKETKPKIEKEIKEKKRELQEERRRLQMTISPAMLQWIDNADENPTIFVFFEIGEFFDEDLTEMIGGNLAKTLELIPNDAKLLITQRVKLDEVVSNSFHVEFDRSDHDFVTTMLEVLHKRWQILDLESVVRETLRTQRVKRGSKHYSYSICGCLSSIARLQKVDL